MLRQIATLCYRRPGAVTTLCVGLLLLCSPAAGAQESTNNPIKTHKSPFARLEPISPQEFQWTTGFWADRFRLCRKFTLPSMKQALLDPDNAAQLTNFLIGAGLKEGTHRGTNWSDGDCYKWLEACAHVYALTKDPELDKEMDYWIDKIAKTQDEDGYICTQIQLNPDKQRWQRRQHHELYNMGHLMTAAAVHYQATGKRNFLRVAEKLAEYLYGVFAPRPKELAHYGWNPSNIMGLVDLYRVTGDKRWLELAGIFVDMRGSVPWPKYYPRAVLLDDHPGDQTQDRVPLRKETEAVGHAVTGTYLYCGAADVAAETGEKELIDALWRIWTDITTRKMYVTGAVGSHHHGVSPRLDLVHEAFGWSYDLPNRSAYNETCANIGNAMFSERLLRLSGDARAADIVELVIYNSLLSAISIDGKHFCYSNPLERCYDLPPASKHDTPTRWYTFHCYCCPPNVARTIAGLYRWVYSKDEDGVWIHIYAGSRLRAKLAANKYLGLEQETNYPWDGRILVRITEAPPEPATIHLRIPGWCKDATLKIDGRTYDKPLEPASYVAITRRWQVGTLIELNLPMNVTLIQANPRVEHTRNQVAVRRGPVVYCLEEMDLPKGVDLDEVRLPADAKWKVEFRPDLLGGVVALRTTLHAYPAPRWTTLYRPLIVQEPKPVEATFIPYYAWNNRERTDMQVWIPLD